MEFQNHELMVSDKTFINDKDSDSRAIGVFDSGIGGITVLRELVKKFPNENFIYLGDTARLPYGSKSAPTVRKYSEQNMKFLISKNVKALVVACNTASTQVSESVFEGLPVYNVIDPGSELASRMTHTNHIAVLATRATIRANSYEIKIKKINSKIEIYSQPCPLFVALAEEGLHDDLITDLVAERYISELKNKNIDTVVLGCTHYPLLKKPILKAFGHTIQLVDSGEAIGQLLETDFSNKKLFRNLDSNLGTNLGSIQICLTDQGLQFENLSSELLAGYTEKKIVFELVTVI